ncbi:MAG: PAS domain-containing protein, partial [Methanolobus sp.]|nr:PAS domain-containing protein [Methanolobus sp.]
MKKELLQSYKIEYESSTENNISFISHPSESENTSNQKTGSLSTNDDMYRSFFKENIAVILLVDPEKYYIVDANDAACNYYGWTIEEIKRKKIDDICHLSGEEKEAE